MHQMADGSHEYNEEDSVIEHNGKKYSKVQISGLGDEELYLMDNEGNIYSLDFKFITNMG